MTKKKGSFYVVIVVVGTKPGIYRSWAEAEQQINGFPANKHEKFFTEAEAAEYMAMHLGSTGLEYNLNTNQPQLHEDNRAVDDTKVLETLLGSMDIGKITEKDKPWRENLRAKHGIMLVAFCAGSAPRNGREGCTGAYAVSFPLENIQTRVMVVTDRPTNHRADCLAAVVATVIADELGPERHRSIAIYTRYEGLVFAMAGDNGRPGWVHGWQENGWTNAKRKPIANQDVYKTLLAVELKRAISWRYLDTKTDPSWLAQLHQRTHDEAQSVASSVARTATGA